jgi:hypothetical protein
LFLRTSAIFVVLQESSVLSFKGVNYTNSQAISEL